MLDAGKNIHVNWKQGKHNLADYPSEHHPTQHHISFLPTSVINTTPKHTKPLFKRPKLPMTLQGCPLTYFSPTIQQMLNVQISNATSIRCGSV